MMKKTCCYLLLIVVLSCNSMSHQSNILESKDIAEIETYIKKAHPDDPKRKFLYSKIIALKNLEWTKGAKTAKPMAARPIAFVPMENLDHQKKNDELFEKLMAENKQNHQGKTVQLLNTLFNEDISNNEVAVLFKNNSDCNMVLKIQGETFYNLPVPAKGENTIVIKKGSYLFTSSVCDVEYSSKKEINKSMMVKIENPKFSK